MITVKAENLTRKFGSFTAVDHISFEIEAGTVFGFLGPNGAGKTTTIRMLCGLLGPTEGTGSVAGFDILREPDSLKKKIGYMSQKFSLYQDLTVIQNLRFYAGVYAIPRAKAKERIGYALEMAGLQGNEHILTSALSGAVRQRLALAASIMHEPDIVFLDEPTAGIDPGSRQEFWRLIASLSREGVTVFVTTHYMDEAEHCDRLVLMYAGRIIAESSPGDFTLQDTESSLFEIIGAPPLKLVQAIRDETGVRQAHVFGRQVHLLADKSVHDEKSLVSLCSEKGFSSTRVRSITPALEDAFMALIGKEERKAESQ